MKMKQIKLKQLLLGTSLFLAGVSVFAQETSTNKEGSSYKFEKIAHLDATAVLSQGGTGTCWSFSAMSFFESELIRMGKKGYDLSEMYIVYQAYLGKADKYIRTDGNTNFDQGGAFHDIPWVIKRFGIVPTSAFSGLNYGSETHSHSELYAVLDGAVEGVLKARNELPKNQVSKAILRNTSLRGFLSQYHIS